MITAPALSTDADTTPRDDTERVGGEAAPVLAVASPRVVWSVSDLLLVGLFVLLASLAAVTAYRQLEQARARRRVADELKSAAAGFQAYLRERGTAPADANVGVVPPGMATYLTGIDWASPTPAGGLYRWVNIGGGEVGAVPPVAGRIEITAFPRSLPLTLTRADWEEIDRRIDDGNLATGNFRTGFNGWPVLTVRAAP